MRISDWSSDVCSSDLPPHFARYPVALPSFSLNFLQKINDFLATLDTLVPFRVVRLYIAHLEINLGVLRSEERRGGNEWVSTCRSRWSPYHEKKNTKKQR